MLHILPYSLLIIELLPKYPKRPKVTTPSEVAAPKVTSKYYGC